MRPAPMLLALLLVGATSGTAMAAGGSSDDHAKRYYVSVGDSLAAGVQPIGDPADLYRTAQGYPEQLLARAKATMPKLSLVKLGCPGESTSTMIDGGICSYAHGSQLDEAVSFLQAHRSLVAFVTIDIGANDFPCQQPECLPAGAAIIQSNLPTILGALRAAAGPDVPIVGMTIHNPFLAAWLQGADGQAFAQLSALGLAQVNALLASIYVASGTSVADVAASFSSNDFNTLVPLPGVGDVPLNVARICQWTWVCAPPPLGPNNHPNTDGYGVIAATYAAMLGL
jgi:lysophospholipase L1-like esterase